MEKAKPSKKKAYQKKRKPEPATVSNKYVDWKQVGKKTSEQDENSRTELDEKSRAEGGEKRCTEGNTPPAREKSFSKRSLLQPESHLGDLDEIWQETNVGQDFEILVNAPLSSSHFVFKSEKNWTLDASKYDEFFSVDVKNLAAIINCIPYNQLIKLDNKYFNKDELTNINYTAEQAKKAYNRTLTSLRKEKLEADSAASRLLASEETDSRSDTDQSQQSARLPDEINPDSEITEEDLDFLLSLKEPVRAQPVPVNFAPATKSSPDELKIKNIPAAAKSIDLEKWLDLVLDD